MSAPPGSRKRWIAGAALLCVTALLLSLSGCIDEPLDPRSRALLGSEPSDPAHAGALVRAGDLLRRDLARASDEVLLVAIVRGGVVLRAGRDHRCQRAAGLGRSGRSLTPEDHALGDRGAECR